MTEKRTDLALEARESFPRNHVEIQGVVLEKKKCLQGKVKITTVIIRDEAGSKAMKKPKGTYITIESPLMLHGDIDEREPFLLCVCEQLESMIKGLRKKSVLVVGLGNREVTSDSLGPKMTDALFVTRHFKEEFGASFMQENGYFCKDIYAEGLIELNLMNELTNYYENPAAGKSCYKAKLNIENMLHELSSEKTNEIMRLFGSMGLGRELVGIFQIA